MNKKLILLALLCALTCSLTMHAQDTQDQAPQFQITGGWSTGDPKNADK